MKYTSWCVLPIAALLAACASNPDRSVYVMPAPTSVKTGVPAAPGTLTLKLRPVILPDYLDTTDLVTRTGQYGIAVSQTGRWGERLSRGVTRALADDLGRRLPGMIITDGPAQMPSAQIQVTVSAFDVTTVTSVLVASWTITGQGDDHAPVMHNGTFTVSVAPPGGDLAVVAAMAETVDELSDEIAATMRAGDGKG
jgi:uncharacterized lipoprotein YmbA